jgi:hypothetical protein
VDGSLQQQTRYPSLIHEVVQEKEAVLLGQYAAELRCFSMELKKKKTEREREREGNTDIVNREDKSSVLWWREETSHRRI